MKTRAQTKRQRRVDEEAADRSDEAAASAAASSKWADVLEVMLGLRRTTKGLRELQTAPLRLVDKATHAAVVGGAARLKFQADEKAKMGGRRFDNLPVVPAAADRTIAIPSGLRREHLVALDLRAAHGVPVSRVIAALQPLTKLTELRLSHSLREDADAGHRHDTGRVASSRSSGLLDLGQLQVLALPGRIATRAVLRSVTCLPTTLQTLRVKIRDEADEARLCALLCSSPVSSRFVALTQVDLTGSASRHVDAVLPLLPAGLTHLTLSRVRPRLRSKVAPHVLRFAGLRHLSLADSGLGSAAACGLTPLPSSMTSLDLSGNPDIEEGALATLLRGGRAAAPDGERSRWTSAPTMSTLLNLSTLNLAGVDFETAQAVGPALRSLPSLTDLDMSDAARQASVWQAALSLPKLRRLRARNVGAVDGMLESCVSVDPRASASSAPARAPFSFPAPSPSLRPGPSPAATSALEELDVADNLIALGRNLTFWRDKVPNLVRLDLSYNMLHDGPSVSNALREMRCLEHLDLSCNQLDATACVRVRSSLSHVPVLALQGNRAAKEAEREDNVRCGAARWSLAPRMRTSTVRPSKQRPPAEAASDSSDDDDDAVGSDSAASLSLSEGESEAEHYSDAGESDNGVMLPLFMLQ